MAIATTLPLPIFTDGGTLTHSSETTFKTCPRKFYLSYRLGLRPSHDSDALRIGSAFHSGLEILKNGGDEDSAANFVSSLYDAKECPPWFRDEPDLFDVERETAIALVRGYARRWAGDLIVRYVAVERSFNLPITNPETGRPTPLFRSAGKIDGIAELPDGRICLIEHKTTSEAIDIASDYWRRLQMDSQVSRYVIAAKELGFRVQTTVYDVVRKPQISPRMIPVLDESGCKIVVDAEGSRVFNKNGKPRESASSENGWSMKVKREDPRTFGLRLLDDLAQRPEFYFARNEVPRLDADLEEFRWEQWQIAQQIHQADKYGRFYRNTAACLSPYRCQFFDVCRGMSGNPNEQIPDGFKRGDVLHAELSTS